MITKIASLALTLLFSALLFAQETVIYQFGAEGSGDGFQPNGGLVFDASGNIYGTTIGGGLAGVGTVFELSPLQDGTWQETILYNFCPGGVQNGCPDGREPLAGLALDSNGNLYGTTYEGGANLFYGTVFELSPPKMQGGSWTEQVLWSFGDTTDGKFPYAGVIIDAAGNLYGTTSETSNAGEGMVFELSPGQNGWTETVLHIFCLDYPDCSDGAQPMAGVALDKAGSLYGTTEFGGGPGVGWGVVYELSPTKNGWVETVLKDFSAATGGRTSVGITFDPAGNMYGGLTEGGKDQCGGFFQLDPFAAYYLPGGYGCSPQANLVYSSGALYGSTTQGGTHTMGTIVKLSKKGNHPTLTVLYDFCQQPNCADGSEPSGSPTLFNGQIYGATILGGVNNTGVIYQVAQ
jgi:uncharacterized repeat protein (TIGR03803 family)